MTTLHVSKEAQEAVGPFAKQKCNARSAKTPAPRRQMFVSDLHIAIRHSHFITGSDRFEASIDACNWAAERATAPLTMHSTTNCAAYALFVFLVCQTQTRQQRGCAEAHAV